MPATGRVRLLRISPLLRLLPVTVADGSCWGVGQGLGGWHWLTLANGDEVRLQRNALSVLEHPTQEQMEENQAEEAREAKATAAALAVGAGAGEGARHQPHHAGGGGTFPRSDERLGFHSSRPKRPPHLVGAQGSRPHLSSQHARSVLRGRVQPPGSARPHNGGMKREHAGVNFAKLETGSLRKYRRYYKLEVGPNASKDQLVHAVKAHFSGQTVDEGNVLTGFILALHGASHSHM